MPDRRAHYAVVEVPSKELLGLFDTVQAAHSAKKQFLAQGAKAESFNLTHGKTPQWVKDLAMEASSRTSPEAEIHMHEGIVRISTRYVLSRKASHLMLEEYNWIPDLDDHLDQERVPGFNDVTVEIGDPDKVVITIDLDVEEQGTTSDPARRGAFQAVDRLLVDISRFKWHASPEMKDDPFVRPVYTSTDFVVVWNVRSETLTLCWGDDDQFYTADVEDDRVHARLAKTFGSIARNDDLIENFAQRAMIGPDAADDAVLTL
jgi:hypothetical protein